MTLVTMSAFGNAAWASSSLLDIPGARPASHSIPWLSFDADGLHYGQAGTTLRAAHGWRASVFVTSFEHRPTADDDAVSKWGTSFVSGRISRNLSKTTRVSLDFINVLDKRTGEGDDFHGTRLWSYPGAADNFLFYPGESRGFRLRLRTTF